VRVMHPPPEMGVEFPSRPANAQTFQVSIEFLTSRPGTMPELLISRSSCSPRSPSPSHRDLLEDHLAEMIWLKII